MRLPFLDRYVIRELIPPFIMALALFLLYILVAAMLGISVSFRDFDLALEDTLRMMMYKLPEMLVLALPFAVLFAVLLACGRLSHDREIIALQNSGVSLRRITLPFLGFGAVVGLLTFAIQDVVVPWTATQSQHQMSQLLGEGPITKIQQNTVFKDSFGRLIYIERYDPESGQLKNIHIVDPNGSIGELAGQPRQNQLVTAASGEWRKDHWILRDGVIHVLNADGALIYQAVFKSTVIQMEQAFGQLVFARQPEQMNYSELSQYIKTLQQTGRPVTYLIVELQTKLIFPFSALVYALIAAPLSLGIRMKGRTAGALIGIILSGVFEVSLIFFKMMSLSGTFPPDLGPWLPHIAFLVIGALMWFSVDRLGRLSWPSLASVFFIAAGVFVVGADANAQPLSININAKAFEGTLDSNYLRAQGDVVATYGEQTVLAQELVFEKESDTQYRLSANRDVAIQDPSFEAIAQQIDLELLLEDNAFKPQVAMLQDIVASFETEGITLQAKHGTLTFLEQTLSLIELEGDVVINSEEFTLSAETLTLMMLDDAHWEVIAHNNVRFEGEDQLIEGGALELELNVGEGENAQLERASLKGFEGEGSFVNAEGETHEIRYSGETAELVFENETLRRLELNDAKLTTCTCAGNIEQASYSFGGRQVTLWPEEWVLGRDLVVKISGVPVFWLPLFFAPLQSISFEQFDYFPTIGHDNQRGWFAQWRLPLFIDPNNRGTAMFDYYNRYVETGLGFDWNYRNEVQSQSGRFGMYHLVGRNEILDINWSNRWTLQPWADLNWSINRRDVRPATAAPSRWAYQLNAVGTLADISWQFRTMREETVQEDEDQDEPPSFRVLERLPEISLSHRLASDDLPISISSQGSWGRFSEQREVDGEFIIRERLDGSLQAALKTIQIQTASMRFDAQGSLRYSWYGEQQQRTSTQLRLSTTWNPSRSFSSQVQYNFQSVQGQSPFAFDEIQVSDVISGQAQFQVAGVQGTVNGSYGVQSQRLNPITLSLNTRIGEHALQGTLRTRSQTLDFELIQAQEVWTAPWGQLTLQGGYSFSRQTFDDLIARLSLEWVRLGARFDPNRMMLRRTNAEFDFRLGQWSLDFNGEYDWQSQRFSALQVGIIHHFCKDCWQAGVYLSGQRIWFQVQINAFPGVGLNYSPTDGELRFN